MSTQQCHLAENARVKQP